MIRKSRRARFQVRFSIAFAAAAIEIAGIILIALYYFAAGKAETDLRTTATFAAAAAASQIDGNAVAYLGGFSSERDGKAERLRKQLRRGLSRLHDILPGVRRVQLLRHGPDGRLQPFLVAGAGLNNTSGSVGMGAPFAALKRPIAGRRILRDEAGAWLVGFAPIRNQRGRPVAAIGVELSADAAVRWNRRFFYSCLFAFLGAVVLAVIFGRKLGSRLSRPMHALRTGAQEIARGNLRHRVRLRGGDEMGELALAFNDMSVRLGDIIREVTSATGDVDGSAVDISKAVENQVTALRHQAMSIAELTANLERIAKVSGEISERAEKVLGSATSDLEHSRNACSAVARVMSQIERVATESERNQEEFRGLRAQYDEVDKVMELINQLAGRTKLIAFNAALEAVSAGEGGQRFGVVAGEIRELADNVMGSANFISDKVRHIRTAGDRLVMAALRNSQAIASASKLTAQTAVALKDMVNRAEALADVAHDISGSTEQQKMAHKEVLDSMRTITNGARQTSRTIAEVSAGTSSLANLSQDLNGLVERFNVPPSPEGDPGKRKS